MFRVVNGTLNPRIALFFMIAMISSPGMFNASAAFLPSSFAMYATMLGMAAFMNWKGGLKTAQGIFWFAIGGILGWPFAIALCIPFLFEEIIFASRGFVAALLVLVSCHSFTIAMHLTPTAFRVSNL
jgi:alpha-1,2-mannosyltransferase